ncbi:MAG: flagellar filament capping protein FliD [Woeseiaceae bacterium]
MPTINAASLGSGLDVRGLVDQLVAAEGGPVTSRLDRKEVNIQEGLTAIGSFKGALIDFQASLAPLKKENAFKSMNANSSNEDIFTVTSSEQASAGSYDIEIEQLAQSQKLKSSTFDSEFDPVGTGTLRFEFGEVNNSSNSFDVNGNVPSQFITIDDTNNSLRGIQESINQAAIGVRASVINDGSGYRLVLSSEKSGLENSLRIVVTDDDNNNENNFGLSKFAYNPVASADTVEGEEVNSDTQIKGKNFVEASAAKNAIFSIDGITISNAENTIRDSITGITLTLKKITEDSSELFKIETETSAIKKSIKSFVTSYNELMTTVNTLTSYNQETRTSGPLSGDSVVRGVTEQIRRALSTSFNGINENLSSLSSIGIDSNRDATLALDEHKLDLALSQHGKEIAHLFSAAVSTSDPKIKVVSEKTPTVDGVFSIIVSQIPKSGSYTGQQLTPPINNIISSVEKFSVKIDGVTSRELKLLPQEFSSAKEFSEKLEGVINNDSFLKGKDKSVTVNFINNKLNITSNNAGADSNVEIRSISSKLAAMTGVQVGQGKQGASLKAVVNGFNLEGDGIKLKLEGSLSGVVLEVEGNKTGERGDITVTNGIASILDEMTNSFLASNGLLDSRIDGYNAKIDNINRQRGDLVRKLELSEQRYLKQFSNLDAMLGKMKSTSNFLAQKLSNLPGARR